MVSCGKIYIMNFKTASSTKTLYKALYKALGKAL